MKPKMALSLAVALAAMVYVGLWIGVAGQWSPLASADTGVLRRFHEVGIGNPAWITAWRVTSDLFSPSALRIVGVVGIGVALIRRETRVAGLLAVTVLPAGLVTAAAKALADRPRPGLLTWSPCPVGSFVV